MTDDVKVGYKPKATEVPKITPHTTEQTIVVAKSGFPILTVLLFILLIMLGIAGAVGYFQLVKQNAALSEQVATMQQQSTNDNSQMQSLTQTVQQIQQANAEGNQGITELYNQLNTINEQLDQLPLPPAPLQQEKSTVPTADETDMSWWQKGLNRTLQALRQIVIVRYNENKTMPLVMPEERNFLYHNLHAQMQNAIWAVLHHNQTVYQTSLGNVTMWVQQYFVQQDPTTVSVLQALNSLRTVNIESQANKGT